MHRKITWFLLIFGLVLRCVALNQPLVDAGLLRQCQTAAVTQSLIEEGGLALTSRIPWVGDVDERFVRELPIYTYLVMGVHALTGNLTLSGKLVSISLWAISFWLLQGIWRRALDPAAAAWANLIFVVSPLGVFYGQAFMPESLVQVLAFAFVLLLIRYDENPTLGRWAPAAFTGLLGLLVKAPATAHLYIIFLFLVVTRSGLRSLFQARYLVAGMLSAACVVAWGNYFSSFNITPLSFGSADDNVRGFIGPWQLRFRFHTWWMVALYLGGFVVPGPAFLAVLRGLLVFVRDRSSRLLAGWLLSLAVFYLLWLGDGPASQGYYNLPALAPLSALFGLGMGAILSSERVRKWRPAATVLPVLITVGFAAPVWKYLYTPDRVILAAALWTRDHTEPGALILFRPTHRADMVDYAFNAVFPFYAERPAITLTDNLPETYRRAALERSRYAVVTLPQPDGPVISAIRKLRGLPTPPRESTDWLLARGFSVIAENERFVAYRRQ